MTELVVAGGGFAGVWAAMGAAAARAEAGADGALKIRLISQDPFLTVRPRLYEPSVGDDVRVRLADVLDAVRVDVEIAQISRVDVAERQLRIHGAGPRSQRTVSWDGLVFACGSLLRRPSWQAGNRHVLSVDTFDEARGLDAHLRQVMRTRSPGALAAVVVGSGLAGIEVATALGGRMRRLAEAADLNGAAVDVSLVEAAPRVAPGFDGAALRAIEDGLAAAGVRVVVGSGVVDVGAAGAVLADGRLLAAGTVVWTGGLEASPLTADLTDHRETDGRVPVGDDLVPLDAVLAEAGVFVAGDAASAFLADGHVSVMSCQHAIPLGRLAGRNAAARLLGLPIERLALPEYVTCVDLGPSGAVFTTGWDRELQLTGRVGRDMKRLITERLIYPPVHDREAALAAGRGLMPSPADALTG